MRIEVGKMYRVGGDCLQSGNVIKITNKYKGSGTMRYLYDTVSGKKPLTNYMFFEDGSLFSKSLEPVVLYENPEILPREQKIVVVQDKNRVTAMLYKDGKKVAAGVAKCSPEDIFDFKTGARIAFDRLMVKNPSMSRDEIYNETKKILSAADDSKRVVALSTWTMFELGKMAVQVNRENIDNFLKECEERGYTWRCGDKATERNPFRDYDGLSSVGVVVFEILKMVPKDSIWIRMHEGKLAMDIDEKPDDVEVYEW